MRTSSALPLLVAIFFAFAGTMAVAEPMTLAKAVEHALANNLTIKSSKARAAGAHAESEEAKARFLPSVDLSASYVKTNNPLQAFGVKLNRSSVTSSDFDPKLMNDPGEIENWTTSLTIKQPIFAGGRSYFGYRAAVANAAAQDAQLASVKRRIRYQVAQGWMKLWLLRRQKEATGHTVRQMEESRVVTMRRVEQGLSLETEILNMDISLAQARMTQRRNQDDIATAQAELASLIGIGSNALNPRFSSSYSVDPLPIELDSVLDDSVLKNAALVAATHQADAAEHAASAANGSLLPEAGLFYRRDYYGEDPGGDDGESWMVAIQLKMNLFAGGGDRAKLKKARAGRAASAYSRQEIRNRVDREAAQLYRQVKTLRDELKVAADRVELAKRSLAIVERQFKEGVVMTADLLGAAAQLENAQVAQASAVMELALARLKFEITIGGDAMPIKENAS